MKTIKHFERSDDEYIYEKEVYWVYIKGEELLIQNPKKNQSPTYSDIKNDKLKYILLNIIYMTNIMVRNEYIY